MAKTPRHITVAEQAYIDSKKIKKDPVFKRCESCGLKFVEEQLSRFGRHPGSPLFCYHCASAEFEKLRAKYPDAGKE